MIKSIINECHKPITAYIGNKQVWQNEWTPSQLFKNGEQGVWFDPSDLSTMFQDVDGLEPVTKDGDPVALIKDKSGNDNHATQETATSRPIYRTEGNLHWLEFDGVDDSLLITNMPRKNGMYVTVGALTRKNSGNQTIVGGSYNSRVFYVRDDNIATFYTPDTDNNDAWSSYVNGAVHSTPEERVAMSFSLFLNKYAVLAISNAAMLHATFDTVYIGCMGSGGYFNGNITNIVLAENISEETQGEVTSYMVSKSGVTL